MIITFNNHDETIAPETIARLQELCGKHDKLTLSRRADKIEDLALESDRLELLVEKYVEGDVNVVECYYLWSGRVIILKSNNDAISDNMKLYINQS